MHVLVTGSSGFVGSAVCAALDGGGHRVRRLVRSGASGGRDAHTWDPDEGMLEPAALDGIDAVVHLAGEGIGERRWTDEQKRRILDSRVRGTDLLARTIARRDSRPSALVSASAVGYYGNRGDELLTEDSPPGDDFLADVCTQWEAATAPAEAAGVRSVHVRSGIVLSATGGTLKRMLTPFRLGLGGRIGNGRQYMSWITLADEVGVILHALADAGLSGAVNATAPEPVTNAAFTATLGRVLRRPTVLPTPLFPLRIVYGKELVEHLLLEGQRVQPARLLADGHEFSHPTLEPALRSLLGRTAT